MDFRRKKCYYTKFIIGTFPTYLHVEDTGNSYSTADTVETERGDLYVVTVLETDAERGQERRPRHLKTHTLYVIIISYSSS